MRHRRAGRGSSAAASRSGSSRRGTCRGGVVVDLLAEPRVLVALAEEAAPVRVVAAVDLGLERRGAAPWSRAAPCAGSRLSLPSGARRRRGPPGRVVAELLQRAGAGSRSRRRGGCAGVEQVEFGDLAPQPIVVTISRSSSCRTIAVRHMCCFRSAGCRRRCGRRRRGPARRSMPRHRSKSTRLPPW